MKVINALCSYLKGIMVAIIMACMGLIIAVFLPHLLSEFIVDDEPKKAKKTTKKKK